MNLVKTREVSTDLIAVKEKQQAAWASGDYAVVGTTLQADSWRAALREYQSKTRRQCA